jgi:hypothetical protein
MLSDIIYAVCLVGYMQAMPIKLMVISTIVNVVVLTAKWFWRY